MRHTLKEQSECEMFCMGWQKWDVMSGVTKTAWDVMSGVTKTVWNVLSSSVQSRGGHGAIGPILYRMAPC